MRTFKTVLALVLALTMLLGCFGTAFAAKKTQTTEIAGTKSEPASDKSAKAEILSGFQSEAFKKNNTYRYADDEIVRAIVILEGESEAEVAEAGSEKAAAQRVKLINEHNAVRKAMTGISYELKYEFTTLLNGFSCDVAYGDLEAIAAIEGVKTVYIANSYAEPELVADPATKMESAGAMTGNNLSQNYGYDGTGIVVAVLDTGLNTTHEAFQDPLSICAETGTLTKEAVEATEGLNGKGVYINGKIPFAYDYAENDADVTDYNGHGTHVSGIVGGYATDVTDEGTVLKFSGGALSAQIVSMKIFKDAGGGTTSDIYFYALEDAYKLGVDVVNMSIGAQNGFTYDSGLETEVFGNIYETMVNAGIVMSVAAGNEYSMAEYSLMGYIGAEYTDYGTVASPSTYYGNVSVASVENLQYPVMALKVGEEYVSYIDSATEEEDMWLTTFGDATAEYVVVTNAEGTISNGYAEDYASNDVTGKIAVVSRGDITFEEKVEFAANAGAIGCIVVNNQSGAISMSIETFEIPAISMLQEALEILMNAETKEIYTPLKAVMLDNPEAALMSTFSNWGTSPMLTLDPTITSVGGRVYSAVIGADDAYEVYSGTSMAAPNASATYANVLSMIYSVHPDMDKYEAAELAKSLMAGTAIPLTDEDGFPYSPRKQGAGLANSYNAIYNYLMAGYIVDPLKELGDDADKTGVYEFSVTLKNDSTYELYYTDFTAYVLSDWITNLSSDPSKPIMGNTLLSDTCEVEATYTVDGVEISEFTLAAGAEISIDVCIKLSEEQKAYFDETFENGAFVEGFVFFNEYYEGEYNSDTHATFLAYYGDWGQAPAMETANSFDLMEAIYYLYNVPVDAAGNTYADYGYSPYDLLVALAGNIYTDANYAYQVDLASGSLVNYLGANLLDISLETYETEFMMEHISISTPKSDGTWYYADAFYLSPSLLRNVRHIVMTVADAETGEVYYVDDTEYIPKSAYDEEEGYWANFSMFQWDGKNANGEYVPSGTVAKVTFDVQLPWGEDENEWMEDVWTFDCTVDYTAPAIESVVYDEEAKTVTVTASDENYLAGIYLANKDYEILDYATFSSEKKGESFTATFDVSEIPAAYVTAMDYATNEMEEWVAFGFESEPATLNFVTPYGTETVETATGEYVVMPKGPAVDSYDFMFWAPEKVEQATEDEVWDVPEPWYLEGDELFVEQTEYTFYALYAALDYAPLEKVNYYFDYGEYEGEWAICGWNVNDAGTDYLTEDPVALDANGDTVRVADFEDVEIGDYYIEFYTNAEGIRYNIEMVDDGLFTIQNVTTGKYLATDAEFNLLFVDEVTDYAVWSITNDRIYTMVYNYGNSDALLCYDYVIDGQMKIFNDSVPFLGNYYASDYFACFFYRVATEEEIVLYYTTEIAIEHVCPSEQFTDVDIEQWYHEAIDFAVEYGIMKGMTETTFEPEGNLTRAQVATMLYRLLAEDSDELKEEPFADVNEGDWFYDSVVWAYSVGIINGMSETSFAPNANITREQLAVMLYRATVALGYDVSAELETDLTAFEDDEKVSGYAKDAMAWANGAGLIGGMTFDNSGKLYLAPQGNATRAQAAKIFMMWIGWTAAG